MAPLKHREPDPGPGLVRTGSVLDSLRQAQSSCQSGVELESYLKHENSDVCASWHALSRSTVSRCVVLLAYAPTSDFFCKSNFRLRSARKRNKQQYETASLFGR